MLCNVILTTISVLLQALPLNFESTSSPALLASSQFCLPNIPHDVRTAIKLLQVDPVIHHTICCPNCFTQYAISVNQSTCVQKNTDRSQVCGTSLRNPDGRPCRLFSTQSLKSWLEQLIRRPGYEALLHVPRLSARRHPEEMDDVWDSCQGGGPRETGSGLRRRKGECERSVALEVWGAACLTLTS
jgi:hypothetical protein